MTTIDGRFPMNLTIEFTSLPKTVGLTQQEGSSAVGEMMKGGAPDLREEARGIADDIKNKLSFAFVDDDPKKTDALRKYMDEWRDRIASKDDARVRDFPSVEITDDAINVTHYVDPGEDPLETLADWLVEVMGDELAKKCMAKNRMGGFYKEKIDDDNPTMPELSFANGEETAPGGKLKIDEGND